MPDETTMRTIVREGLEEFHRLQRRRTQPRRIPRVVIEAEGGIIIEVTASRKGEVVCIEYDNASDAMARADATIKKVGGLKT